MPVHDASPTTPIRRWIVLTNERSGAGDDDVARALAAALDGRHELRRVDDPSRLDAVAAEAVREALTQPGTGVAAHGGDGTLNTVANAAWNAGCTIGVLPGGTFNYFARTHRIPSDPAEAARVLAEGAARPVQVGLANGRVFLVNASVGLYPQLLEDREAFKERFGRRRAVALMAAAWTLLARRRVLHLVLDPDGAGPAAPVALDTATVFVGNNRLQLDQIGIADAPAVDAGRLVVVVLKPLGVRALLGVIARGASGQLGDADAVASFPTAAVRIDLRSRSRLRVAADGEVRIERMPLEVAVAPRPLQVVLPGPALQARDESA